MNWVIKAIYPHGGHTVMLNDAPLRFDNKEDATHRAETLNATTRKADAAAHRPNTTSYIVVEEGL
jgi:hypothetical protein